jgi:hypothetical protein
MDGRTPGKLEIPHGTRSLLGIAIGGGPFLANSLAFSPVSGNAGLVVFEPLAFSNQVLRRA